MAPRIFIHNGKHMVKLNPDPPKPEPYDRAAQKEWDKQLLKEKREHRIMRKKWEQMTPTQRFERQAVMNHMDIKSIANRVRDLLKQGLQYEMLTSEQQACLDVQD
ncbi:hypothetical protein Moror_11899 [Moniliophthora roreri MCA 2997]|uniref:Uncharacterized protein n=1 Tax=Moniliophthora roreri (strain MCA 2997) TaxID=1381753 RepID=V2X2W8_MONRO|nr:hypothetical protein Moror_11899 [Moniliophthora roreri MCA 2997]